MTSLTLLTRQWCIAGFLFALLFGANTRLQGQDSLPAELRTALDKFTTEWANHPTFPHGYHFREVHGSAPVKLQNVVYQEAEKKLILQYSINLSDKPFRPESTHLFYEKLRSYLPAAYSQWQLEVQSNGLSLEALVPNYYRQRAQAPAPLDSSRLQPKNATTLPRRAIVQQHRALPISAGLQQSNLALWNSHGWYYEAKLDRWEWQRARLFTSVEDLMPTAYVVQYLAPMLENAGAQLFLPRERCPEAFEYIIDNDPATAGQSMQAPRNATSSASGTGFALGTVPYDTQNPFRQGSYLHTTDSVVYELNLPQALESGLYVSYGKGQGRVSYRVNYSGGSQLYYVDQTAAYGTWVYLGRFRFEDGKSTIVLRSADAAKPAFTADAIRFGGGMGVVARNGQTSGRAKFHEAARYYMQYCGAPDTLVWNLKNGTDDYADDYQGRGEWVNWLVGGAAGPEKAAGREEGLQVPIDLAFAFHTDAGVLPQDSIVGTLAIYSAHEPDARFPNGQSRYVSRDLSDLVQTQIVDDLLQSYRVPWTRRGMWNKRYSEAYRPNVPTMLLELLSHQNFADVRWALEPDFQFRVARAIYKAMLRFVATQHGTPYVVQPLAVQHFVAQLSGPQKVRLSWQPVADPLEPSAAPTHYLVQHRVGQGGFSPGVLTTATSMELPLPSRDVVHSYRVIALNAGGQSFPSEVLAVGQSSQSAARELLVVNAFDRLAAPHSFHADTLSGFMRFLDAGVAYQQDLLTTGDQYDFNTRSPWLDDDSPGHGASYARLETSTRLGNTFDFVATHGADILAAGHSFSSASDEALENPQLALDAYPVLDLLYGEEKSTRLPQQEEVRYALYTPQLLARLEAYTQAGGHLLVSGAYLGTELQGQKALSERVAKLLHFKWRTHHAVQQGQFVGSLQGRSLAGNFCTEATNEHYACEAPDAIEPAHAAAHTFLRYTENNTSAAVAHKADYAVVALGFPIECIADVPQRQALMQAALLFLLK